jgi:sigma-B regulation protein RsbU (phosphoserine phosphatase)
MAEKILLAQQETDTSRSLCRLLRDEGYYILKAATLPETGRLLRELPDLLLLDTELGVHQPPQFWSELAMQFQQNNVSCLLFSSQGREPALIKSLDPWVSDTILQPVDPKEVRFKVSAQLTIRRLTYEADLANRMLLEKQRELEEYQRSAAEIQLSLLPRNTPELANLHFAWRFMPCEKVGGDLFNIMQVTEDTVMAYLIDVSGHGISSAMVTVSVYQSLSPLVGRIIKQPISEPPYFRLLSPEEVLEKLEQEYPFERFGKFFTISYLLINIRTGQVCYSNAGHPPPLLVRKNGPSESLDFGGSIIGTGCSGPFEEGNTLLRKGDRLYLYSDGIIEHSDFAGNQFGQTRLYRKLESLKILPLEPSCEKIIESLHNFGRGTALKDDVTMIGIEFLGNGKGDA